MPNEETAERVRSPEQLAGPREGPSGVAADVRPEPRDRLPEPERAEGLQEIIHRPELKRPNRVLLIGGGEDHGRSMGDSFQSPPPQAARVTRERKPERIKPGRIGPLDWKEATP